MPEILLLGSFYLYQEAFAFSMTLFGLAMFGKLLAFGNEVQQKKQSAEAGKELTKNFFIVIFFNNYIQYNIFLCDFIY